VPGPPRPRVRFAPSPTGYFHVGSARTALFNWLHARRNGGSFVLRIEDTDTERNRKEWTDGIISAMTWLGMEPDEGPFHQSERGHHYRTAIDLLWAQGALYACDCTREAVEERTKANATPGYDGWCRDRGVERQGHALRFRVPDEGETVVRDVIRGDVVFPHSAIEDFVVVRANGNPLFLLVNVVDDAEMRISHVIRGEDLLPSTPKQLLLWTALQGPQVSVPVFAHLPMLVNEQRRKLSKRKDPVAVESYREEGYLPAAMVNYLSLLGWSPPDGREILTRAEIVDQFRLEDVNHAPAFFDVAKLRHVNGEYIRAMTVDEFVDASVPWTHGSTTPWTAERFDEAAFRRMTPLVQERVTVLGEVPAMVDFLFLEEPIVDEDAWNAVSADDGAGPILQGAVEEYRQAEWNADVLHAITQALADRAGRKLGKAQVPIRVAVTGRRVGPPLFESMEVLGRDAVVARLEAARRRLGR